MSWTAWGQPLSLSPPICSAFRPNIKDNRPSNRFMLRLFNDLFLRSFLERKKTLLISITVYTPVPTQTNMSTRIISWRLKHNFNIRSEESTSITRFTSLKSLFSFLDQYTPCLIQKKTSFLDCTDMQDQALTRHWSRPWVAAVRPRVQSHVILWIVSL
jgi:hypothetical protein